MPYTDLAQSQPGPTIIIPTEKDTLRMVRDEVSQVQKHRAAHEKQWLINIAFLYGKQYFAVDKRGRGGDDERVIWELRNIERKKKTRRVSNYILPLYRSILARLLMMKSNISVEPLTRSARDIDSAKVSQEALEDFWLTVNKNNPVLCQEYAGMQGVLIKLFGYMLTCGRGYLKPYFNPNASAKVVFDAPDGGKLIGDYFVGQVEAEVINAFEAYPDPMKRWFNQKKILSVDDIANIYGIEIKPEAIELTDVEQQLMTLLEEGQDAKQKYENAACIYEHYSLPTQKYPHGRFVLCTNDKVIEDTVMPNEYKMRLPFFKFDYLDLMLSPYPQGMVEQLVSLQEEYNYTVSRLAEYKKWFAGKLKVPKGCKLETKYDDEVGQMVIYDQNGGEPKFEAPPSPPSFLTDELLRIRKDMEDIAATHDISMSRLPSGVTSGVAMENLTELDNSQLSPVLISIEQQLAFFSERVLDIMEARYTENRLVGITGDSLAAQVKTFKGSDTKGQRRIKISMGSSIPTGKEARQNLIFKLKEQGMITPEKATELLEFGDLDGVFHNQDESVQKTEIEEMVSQQGLFVEVQDWDNHSVHLKVLDDFLKSEHFKKIPDQSKSLIIEHRRMHQDRLSQEMQTAQNMGGQNGAD
jgi:hypothetical protein